MLVMSCFLTDCVLHPDCFLFAKQGQTVEPPGWCSAQESSSVCDLSLKCFVRELLIAEMIHSESGESKKYRTIVWSMCLEVH